MPHVLYVGNAFSLSMLDKHGERRAPLYLGDAAAAKERIANWLSYGAEIVSCVGHADTAAVFSQILGLDLPVNRTSVKLDDHSCILVGQYSGPRLPEGATTLPEGATIEWWIV